MDITYFNTQKILQRKKYLIQTANLELILQCCIDAQAYNLMLAIIGEPGYGKSAAFAYYKEKFPDANIYYLTIEKSMSAKSCYTDLMGQLQISQAKTLTVELNKIIRAISYTLNASDQNNLIIFDEAGKFSPRKLLFLHELRDATRHSTGFILAAPSYFKNNLDNWKLSKVEGIPELHRLHNRNFNLLHLIAFLQYTFYLSNQKLIFQE